MNTNIVGKPKEELAQESISLAAKAKALRIVDAQSCINASAFLRSVKGLRSDIQSWFAPHIEAAMETKCQADRARAALVDEKDRMEAPLVEAEGVVKRALLAWEASEDERRRAEEQRLQEDARQRAETLTLEAAASIEIEARATGDAGMLQEAQDILEQPIEQIAQLHAEQIAVGVPQDHDCEFCGRIAHYIGTSPSTGQSAYVCSTCKRVGLVLPDRKTT